MNRRAITYIITALVIFVGLMTVGFVALAMTVDNPLHILTAGPEDEKPDTGSLFRPQYAAQERTSYVLAELYQDLSQGNPQPHQAGSCAWEYTIADQPVRALPHPTLAPPPTPPPSPTATPPPPLVTEYRYQPTPATNPRPPLTDGNDWAGAYAYAPPVIHSISLVTPTPTPGPSPTPTATPVPTPTMVPTPVPQPAWVGWRGRAVSLQTDGLAIIESPRDVAIRAEVRIYTGDTSNRDQATELARLPVPSPRHWTSAGASLHLADASGRINLASDRVDVAHAFAVLHVEIVGSASCTTPVLRWQRPAGVVISALTDNPFDDWGLPTMEHDGGPLLAALVPQASGRGVDAALAALRGDNGSRWLTRSSLATHINIPTRCAPIPSPAANQDDLDDLAGCVRVADDARLYITFAVRADIAPADGLTTIEETGSGFNILRSFQRLDDGNIPDADGDAYQLYISLGAWEVGTGAGFLGAEWTLR